MIGFASPQEAVMSSTDPVAPSLSGHLRTLGIYRIVYGVIRLIMTVCLLIFASTATVMFGTLLNRVPDPLTLMSVFHSIYTVNDSFVGCLWNFGTHGWTGFTFRTSIRPHARPHCRVFVALQYSAGYNSGHLHPR